MSTNGQNIELPSEASLNRLAPEKTRADIIRPMRYLAESIRANRGERRAAQRAPAFAPGGHSPQLVIGASPESDFQIEVNKADAPWLLRVPGIGVIAARRIIAARRFTVLDFRHLPRLGVVLKRAQWFISCNGRHRGGRRLDAARMHATLAAPEQSAANGVQLALSI